MNQFLRYISILILFFVSVSSFAQESECAFKLQEAEDAYETGDLDSIPSMLRDCISNHGFDDEELARAYRLLIKTYLFEDYQEMAELTMLKFLKKFPEYEIRPTDPVEFTYLYKSYQTVPVYSIGIIGGVNYSFVRIIEPYSLDGTEDYEGGYSSSGVTYQFGLQIKRYINRNIDINLDVIYTSKIYNNTLDQIDSKIIYDETQSMLSFPLSGTYDFMLGKFSPYVRLGVNLDYMLSASANLKRNIESDVGVDDVTGSAIDIFSNRKPCNISALIGGGVKYNVKKGYIMLDLRYNMGFTNNVNGENRRAIQELWSDYNYVDDDFSLNNLFISAGYVFSFYQTKNNKK
ncbi:MAG: outer membrane beta-barrel protein [Bacteroidales bacterium]|nr:outer membrane beta-barrel protein [Bacteroidales bacterium]